MGLLESFNLDDPKTMGLLMAGAQMLDAGGPSPIPISTGQALSRGLMGGLEGMQQARQMQQMQAIRDLQTKQANMGLERGGMELQQMRDAMARNKSYQDAVQQYGQMQAAGNSAQTGMPSSPDGTVGIASPGGAMSNYQRHIQFADFLRSKGFTQEADDAYDKATKFMPKVKNWQEIKQGGKVMYAPYFEDGTAGQPVPYEVAAKLQFQNLGGKTVGLDAYTGAQQVAYGNTLSPGEAARIAQDERHFQAGQAAPQFNADVGGFIAKPSKANPNGAIIPLAGYTKPDKPLTESQGKAANFLGRMKDADVTINDLIASGTKTPSLTKQAVEDLPLIGGTLGSVANKFAASPDQQRMEQAQRDFVNAVLRQESGASISPAEFENARKQYFPQPGDSKAVIEQKAKNRQTAIQGMGIQAGPGVSKLPIATSPAASGKWSIQRVE